MSNNSSSGKATQSQNRPPLPVDRGWAWFIMLGAFINFLISLGFIRSWSILLLEFLDKFQQSATMTTLAFGLNTASSSLFSIIVSTIFLPRLSARMMTLIGGLIHAVSITAMGFAPNIIVIQVLFTVLGVSYPFIYIAQASLLGVYFKKKLSFAFAFSNIGVSIATMGAPALTQYLLNEYGLQGALLIHGGLSFNIIVASLLFTPPRFYAPPHESVETRESNHQCTDGVFKLKNPPGCESIDDFNSPNESNIPVVVLTCGQHNDGVSEHAFIKNKGAEKQPTSDRFMSSGSLEYLNSSLPCVYKSHSLSNSKWDPFDKEINDIGDRMSDAFLKGEDTIDGLSQEMSPEKNSYKKWRYRFCPTMRQIKDSINVPQLGIMLMLMCGFGSLTQCGTSYIPSLGKELGLPIEQLPLLVTVIGIGDFFKLAIGLLADQDWVRRIHIVGICLFINGVMFQFVPFFYQFGSMVIFCIVFGANTEVVYVLLPAITSDLLGQRFIGHVMSGFYIVNGMVVSLTHVLIGYLKDTTGSFISGYHFMGGLILFSVVIIGMESVVYYHCRKTRKKQDQDK